AAWTGADPDTATQPGCVELSVHYLARGGDEDAIAEARVLRRGRDLTFLDVMVRSRAGGPICHGVLIYQAPDHPRHPPRRLTRPALLPPPVPVAPPAGQRLYRGYVKRLGIAPLHESPGRARLSMPGTPLHLDETGMLHAGALASLVDIAAVAASWSLVR